MSPVNMNAGSANPAGTFGLASQGIDTGLRAMDSAAQAVASDGTHGQVSATNTVNALEARTQVAASARLFQTADQMLGTLLDLRA
jgi:hypothetical protein